MRAAPRQISASVTAAQHTSPRGSQCSGEAWPRLVALHRLRGLAKARGVSFGELVREALEEKLEREQPGLTFLGTARRSTAAPSAREADERDLYRPDPPRSVGP